LLGRFALLARLILDLSLSDPQIANRDKRLPRLPPLGYFGIRRGGLGSLELCLLRRLRGAKTVG